MSQCVTGYRRLSEVACGEYTLNGETYTESGTYTQAVYEPPCDSTIIILTLVVHHIIHPQITVSGFNLSTAMPYATYQWFINGNLIPGATNSTYTVVQNGNYTVAVTDTNGCADTSDLYRVDNANAIKDQSMLAQRIKIYPNPASDVLHIVAPVKVNILMTSIEGKVIRQIPDATIISVKALATGMYLLRITDRQGRLIKVEKWSKTEE